MSQGPLRALLPALLAAATFCEAVCVEPALCSEQADKDALSMLQSLSRVDSAMISTDTQKEEKGNSAISINEAPILLATNPEKEYTDGVVLELSQGGGRYKAKTTTTRVEAIKIKGGLIQTFELNGKNILFFGEHKDQMDGSIFWLGPQSAWGWPPPIEIDPTPSKDFTMEYTLDVDEEQSSFTLTSPVSHDHNIQVSKQVSMDPDRAAVVVDNAIINMGGEAKSWAPWEVSRVRPNGMTFYATGSSPPTSGTWPALPVTEKDGITWFLQNVSSGGKLFADTSQGWLAHTDGELVMVQCFENIPTDAAAPGEQQIEIYDGGSYVEVEAQGAYMPIAPGGRLEWNMLWYLREMPPGAVMAPGDEKLVALVTGLCG